MGLTSVKIAPAPPFITAPSTTMVEIRRIKIGSRMRPLGDLSALMESIRAVGLLNAITVTAGLRLVDGLHRLEACRRLGHTKIPAIVLHLTDDEAQLIEIDENLIRNDLTVLERAEHYYRRKQLYDSLFPDTKQGGRRGNQHTGGIKRQVDNLAFCHETANKTGESSRTIRRLLQIARNLNIGAKKLLRDTEWATNCQKLLKLSKLDARLQKAIAAKVAKGEAINVNEAASKVHIDAWLAKPCALPLKAKGYRLLHGDFRKVGTEIPSSSINLILTDAPYETAFLDVFGPLSLFANRVLVDGGSLLIMIGHYHLPRILHDLSAHLEYHWTIASIIGGGRQSFVPNRLVHVAYKPILWFQKGIYRGKAVRDIILAGKQDKRFHPHGQSEDEFLHLVQRFTKMGDTVLDPFVGGGSVASAAMKLNREFIGIDKDRRSIEATRRRIEVATARPH